MTILLVKFEFVPVSVLIEPVLAESPPAKVLVPCPAPTVNAPAIVVVAVPVTVKTAVEKLVVVALVPVAFTKVKFWKLDWPRTPVVVAKYEPE